MTAINAGTIPDIKEKTASSAIPSIVADIVSAYVSNNSVPVADLPTLISDVNAALVRLTTAGTDHPRSRSNPPYRSSVRCIPITSYVLRTG